MIVSSVAPPTKRSRCERTVTRALTFTPMPSLATPSIVVRPIAALGTSMIFGLMLVRTASSTVLPVPLVARSIAQARLKSSEMPALSAAMSARMTWLTSPPGEVMRLERIARDVDAGFDGGDAVIDDQADRHFAQTHADHLANADRRVRDAGAEPESEEVEDDDREDEGDDRERGNADEVERFHDGKLRERSECGKR